MHRESFTEDYDFDVSKNQAGGYSVCLPHQCDSWEIVGADIDNSLEQIDLNKITDGYPNLPKDKNVAIKQMELFIKKAKEALEKLNHLN